MLNVIINGQIAHKKAVKTYTETVLAHLLPRVRRNVDVEITFVTRCDDNAYGYCWGDKNCVEIEIGRKYNAKCKFKHETLMRNLAHELVHAKQFIKGELHPTLSKWKKYKKDYTKTPYLKQPWEKEAYKLEGELLNKYWK